jgi:hypothetical protein
MYPFRAALRRSEGHSSIHHSAIMRNINVLLVLVSLISLVACAKAGKEVAEELGIIPSSCGSDGARIQATVNGNDFCADGQIIAVSDGVSVMITGIGLLGNTLSLQIDSIAEGTFPVTEAENAVLYMTVGSPYSSMPDHPGTITITGHDETTHRIKADLAVTVRNEMNGATKGITASVDVTYSTSD